MAAHQSIAAPVTTGMHRPAVRRGSGVLAALGAAAGLGAIAASSCCIIPLALVWLGAGTAAFSALEALAPWRLPLLGAGGMGVAAGWLVWWIGRGRCAAGSACAAPRRSWIPPSLLVLASLVVAAAIGWNQLELPLLSLVRPA
ncbi:hypothetical protein [Inquilinus limosus]|uniref:hypothetical protein n=1 Tax=Inquilinus limosus TaxID=171674 RepID=UPI000479A8DE|nr:hypothetical protein [Inquilinus limosus]